MEKEIGNFTMQYSLSTFKHSSCAKFYHFFFTKFLKSICFMMKYTFLSQFWSYQLSYFWHHRLLEFKDMLSMCPVKTQLWNRSNLLFYFPSPYLYLPNWCLHLPPHCWRFQTSLWLPREPTCSSSMIMSSSSMCDHISLYIVFLLNALIRAQFRMHSFIT